MLILVANLGTTSFKFKLLDMSSGCSEVARGGFERIGQPGAEWVDHGQVIDVVLKSLERKPDAIGFKAVHGGPISGAVRVTDEVIATMQQFADFAPAHNPPYIAAMKMFAEKMPGVPQVAAFETAFHRTIPASRATYAIPFQWTENYGIRRYGFHGATHRYAATRVAELSSGKARRIINCHLGGSSSVCAILDGKSVATSMGLTPQTGLPQNNRVGDFDAFAFPRLMKEGMTVDEVLRKLGKESGLLGMSGVSNDMRDIEKAAAEGNARAGHTLDAFAESVRHYIGAYMVALGGIDVLSFSGGIGENGIAFRKAVCSGLEWLGIELDDVKNNVRGKEALISRDGARAQIITLLTNEEMIVAKQTAELLWPKADALTYHSAAAPVLDYQKAGRASDALVVAAKFGQNFEANLALSLLQANGIDARLAGENMAELYGGAIGSATLLVPADQLDAAKALLPERAGGTNKDISSNNPE